ncbi:MAS20 protein import receptor-domain-containing protein [Sporodiniella umbellata]|nr:MAS20 protein import receptor-domain-containing protein [Sporodiniella umbellata]
MALKPTTVALISTAIIATFGIGYIIYFDKQRRSDPNFKKHLKRERKKQAKNQKEAEKEAIDSAEKTVELVLKSVAEESFPESPEEKEKYFMEQVSAGEALVQQNLIHESIVHFYKALKIYPSPLELLNIFQQTLPEHAFRLVVNIMAVEQQQRQTNFYKEFPSNDVQLKLEKTIQNEKPVYCLSAEQDFEEGEVLYTETPLVSTLHPELEGSYCNRCMKELEQKIECKNCDQVNFCSEDCESSATNQYHQFLCTNNKLEAKNSKATEFMDYSREKNLKCPTMAAKLFCIMVAEELDKTNKSKYNSWDHIERQSPVNVEVTESHTKEIQMIKELLSSKVPGIEEFLSEEIYHALLSKFHGNTYDVECSAGEAIKVSRSRYI